MYTELELRIARLLESQRRATKSESRKINREIENLKTHALEAGATGFSIPQPDEWQEMGISEPN